MKNAHGEDRLFLYKKMKRMKSGESNKRAADEFGKEIPYHKEIKNEKVEQDAK